ncbi:ATP-dependent DNA helicase [Fimbriimonas ginsengisoli]|uniref:DNA 5'-3' helicase n=1 Tax=Fimbriimonas ginsengisoli Gsoil 348 TaxID=661478 RepID=A0A068NP67_FIMGI|nr:ATP-dependent DNA helicase [Fimbriimonas ginsengisoli]AIE85236.1 DinG family ATP-dependent helicase YoaA [Fimbriimonas ginsengisoli Gsoil 348]
MSTAAELIEKAFDTLSARPGFVSRSDQRQLALLLCDLIEEKSSGAFEAPTGLGKSLASLIPAMAHALESKRRTVIATYTNVLAEQYWRKDLPLARALFEAGDSVKAQLLMGRARYACLASMEEHIPETTESFRQLAEIGHESDFRALIRKPARELSMLWSKVATPPVCPGRLCPAYDDCFYYKARRQSERAEIVITNHSVVIQDALMKRSNEDSGGLLGHYDFLILDEAHDFPTAAGNGLEFELSGAKLGALAAVAHRMESALLPLAQRAGDGMAWLKDCADFKVAIESAQKKLIAYSIELGRPGILTGSPPEMMEHPQVRASRTKDDMQGAKSLASEVSDSCEKFVKGVDRRMDEWREEDPERVRQAGESIRNYGTYLREYGIGCFSLFDPQGVAVSYAGQSGATAMLRQDVIDLAEPLKELIWDKTPYACLSATLATDGNFEFFRRVTGAEPRFEEILPTPFDFGSQAALYLPPVPGIPDPTIARREGNEEGYWRSVASELSKIIVACGGRTLALFHSRKEMEGVYQHMNLSAELPIYMQLKYGAAMVGERFKANVHSSLFALRSYWTGFDAPGETLSCVVLVRVPFEVPIDPPQIARLAYLQTQGRDAFFEHTLPMAKMMIRQGAGRLIRHADDRGLIVIIDPRVQTKGYGEQILANLPPEMRTFRNLDDAVGWIGLEPMSLL